MKNKNKILGLLIVATLMIAGCSSNDSEEEQPKEDETVQIDDDKKEDDKNDVVDSEKEIKSKVLVDIMNTKQFTVELKQTTRTGDLESVSLVTNVISDDNIYSYSETEGTMFGYIEKGDKLYLLDHEEKTITTMDRYDDDTDETNASLVYDDLEYISNGKEMFLGNKRAYEEYKTELGTVKYYLNGKDLDGMKTIIEMGKLLEDDDDEEFDEDLSDFEDATIIIEILSYEKDADMSVFELPEDYEIFGN